MDSIESNTPPNELTVYLKDGSQINADFNVIIRKCQFFRYLLDPRFKNDHNKDIYFMDYDSHAIRQLFKFLLDNELDITKQTNIAQLLALGDLMCLQSLYLMVCQVFDDVLCDRNCFQILEFTLQRNYQELTCQCWKYIFKNYPFLKFRRKKYDWNYNTLKSTLTSTWLRSIEMSSMLKYFKYWSIVHISRYKLLKKVIWDILQNETVIKKYTLLILEMLSNLYDNNYCGKLCKYNQKLNLFVIGGHLGDVENFYDDKFMPHNEFHDNIQSGYSITKSIPDMKIHRVFSASAADSNGFYIIGGRNIYGDVLDSVEYYDYDENKWTKEILMEEPKLSCAAVCINDALYVSGGRDVNNRVLRSVYIYLESLRSWKRIADLNQSRAGHQMCSVYGIIYVVGGYGENNDLTKTVEYYDVFLNKWIPVSSMQFPRWRFGIGVVRKCIFIFGGIDLAGNTISHIEKYDTSSNMWSIVTNIQGVYDMGVSVYDKIIFVCGGNTNNGPTNLIQMFHAESGVLRIINQLKIKRSGLSVFVLPDNELFFRKFTYDCDTLKYIESRDTNIWDFPTIQRNNIKSKHNDSNLIFDTDLSLR